MEAFVGKAGAYYVRNPFGAKDYHFAAYPTREDYGKVIPGYVSETYAYADCSEAPVMEERWQIISPAGTEIVQCDLTGKMANGRMVYEYLETLTKKYGYEAVKSTRV